MKQGRVLLRTLALLVALLAPAALVARNLPDALAALRDPQRVVDADGADVLVLHAAQLVLLILCVWCALGAIVVAWTATRGTGRMGWAADRLLPASSQRMLAAALGVGVLSLTACAQPSDKSATPPSTTPLYAASADAFDWSLAPNDPDATTAPPETTQADAVPEVSQPDLPQPDASQAGPQPQPGPSPSNPSSSGAPSSESTSAHSPSAAAAVEYVVSAGDSLWSIAAAHLGPGHTPAEVAYLVDELYQLNQAAIGPNPDQLAIGAQLAIPA